MSNDPKEFYNQIKEATTEDLQLILKEQRELFDNWEIEAIEQELLSRCTNTI